MRDPNRIDKFSDEFSQIWKRSFPDWRWTQLILNFMGWVQRKTKTDGFYIEEDKLLELFKEYANTNSAWFREN